MKTPWRKVCARAPNGHECRRTCQIQGLSLRRLIFWRPIEPEDAFRHLPSATRRPRSTTPPLYEFEKRSLDIRINGSRRLLPEAARAARTPPPAVHTNAAAPRGRGPSSITINSSAPATAASSSSRVRTDAGEPTKTLVRKSATNRRSSGLNGYAAASSGLAMGKNWPRRPAHGHQVQRRAETVGLRVGFGDKRRDRQDQVRPGQTSGRRLEALAVSARGGQQPVRAEMMRERVTRSPSAPPAARRSRSIPAARRRQRHVVGQRAHGAQAGGRRRRHRCPRRPAVRRAIRETRRRRRVRACGAAPCAARPSEPGRAAQAQVDPARVQRLQRAERLRDAQRRVVGQHDAPGADAHPRGHAGEVPDEHFGRGGNHAGQVMVFADPVTSVARGRRRAGRGPPNCAAPARRSNRRSAARGRARKAGKPSEHTIAENALTSKQRVATLMRVRDWWRRRRHLPPASPATRQRPHSRADAPNSDGAMAVDCSSRPPHSCQPPPHPPDPSACGRWLLNDAANHRRAPRPRRPTAHHARTPLVAGDVPDGRRLFLHPRLPARHRRARRRGALAHRHARPRAPDPLRRAARVPARRPRKAPTARAPSPCSNTCCPGGRASFSSSRCWVSRRRISSSPSPFPPPTPRRTSSKTRTRHAFMHGPRRRRDAGARRAARRGVPEGVQGGHRHRRRAGRRCTSRSTPWSSAIGLAHVVAHPHVFVGLEAPRSSPSTAARWR